MNSEYSVEEARKIIIGGLKGYERLLSLSKDITNPRWKPLHMAGSWNARNRRMAKLKSKNNWYKGKEEVPPPSNHQDRGAGTRIMDDKPLEVGSRQDTTPPGVPVIVRNDQKKDGESSRRQDKNLKKAGQTTKNVKNKKRGSDRRPLTLGVKKTV